MRMRKKRRRMTKRNLLKTMRKRRNPRKMRPGVKN